MAWEKLRKIDYQGREEKFMTTFINLDSDIDFPDSDGKPMADNTEQFRWIVLIKENLEMMFSAFMDVFVAGDLLWYPIQDKNVAPQAPDAMVAFGVQKKKRGSYQQWKENNIAPQVVFEILSPSNKNKEMKKKFEFYQTHGVEEYYLYNPDKNSLEGWIRENNQLAKIQVLNGWISPRLAIKFDTTQPELIIYRPNGQRFLSFIELQQLKDLESRRADMERQRADMETQRADMERQRADMETQRADMERQNVEIQRQNAETQRQRAEMETQRAEMERQTAEMERQTAEMERQRAEQMAAYLRSLGIDPENIP
jgi:Uma2 family endonuclease